jgi:hypothetical protein
MSSKFHPTIPVDEFAAGRIAVYLDHADVQFLAGHCACNEATPQEERERCQRIRFRSHTAIHKSTASPSEVDPASNIDFALQLHFLSAAAGGRASPVTSGYRPQMFIDGDDCDVSLLFDVPQMNPGDSGLAFGFFYKPARNFNKLVVSKPVLLREGTKTIAYGLILWHRRA